MQQCRQAVAQRVDIARRYQKASCTVGDDLGHPANATAHDGRAAGHRLDHGEPEQLGDRHVPTEAGELDRREHEYGVATHQARELLLRHGACKCDLPGGRRRPTANQLGVSPLGPRRVVAVGAGDGESSACWQRLDQPVDTLVRRDATDEQNAFALLVAVGVEAVWVGAPEDDGRAFGGSGKDVGGVPGNHQEAVDEPSGIRAESCEHAATLEQPVVGDDAPLMPDQGRPQRDRRDPASELVAMDDLRSAEGAHEPVTHRMRGMAAYETPRAQHDDLEPALIVSETIIVPERHEAARHMSGQRPRQLERIPFASSEEAVAAKGGGRHVRHPHAANLADHPR